MQNYGYMTWAIIVGALAVIAVAVPYILKLRNKIEKQNKRLGDIKDLAGRAKEKTGNNEVLKEIETILNRIEDRSRVEPVRRNSFRWVEIDRTHQKYRERVSKIEAAHEHIKSSNLDSKILLDDYKIHIELYKHYLTVVATFIAFYYGITGGILGYYFTNVTKVSSPGNELLRWSVLFPAFMTFFFAIVFYKLWRLFLAVEKEVEIVAVILGVTRREVRALTTILFVSFFMYVINFFALSVLAYKIIIMPSPPLPSL